MRSIFVAMIWETLKRGCWVLPIGFAGGNSLSVLLFTSLAGAHIAVTRDPEFVKWHLIATQFNMLCFASAVIAAQGKPERYFTLPISNRRLAAYHLLIGMSLMVAESLLSTVLLNALWGLDWPLWGPALFGAAALAAVYAALWTAGQSLWLGVELWVVGAIGGVWYRCRFGPFLSRPLSSPIYQRWDDVTIDEFLTLVAAALIAYAVGVVGFGWRRRGEPPLSVGFVDWARRLLDPPLEIGRPFRSPAEAQLWFERRQKGHFMPGAVAVQRHAQVPQAPQAELARPGVARGMRQRRRHQHHALEQFA